MTKESKSLKEWQEGIVAYVPEADLLLLPTWPLWYELSTGYLQGSSLDVPDW
jgi:hypothetical protein